MKKSERKRLEVYRSLDLIEPNKRYDLLDFIKDLQDKLATIPEEYHNIVSIEYDYDSYDGDLRLIAHWTSPETDEEYNKRIEVILERNKVEKEMKLSSQEKEKELLKSLMKKYPKIVEEYET